MEHVTHNAAMFSDQPTYFATRRGWPARASVKVMEVAVNTNRHVICETTGRGTWLVSNVITPAAQRGFTIILVYVLAPIATIAPRALQRKNATGQGHPPFHELGQTCVAAARNLHAYVHAGGPNTVLWFADNSSSTLRLHPQGDPHLATLAHTEPYQLEERAMLLRNAQHRPYTLAALVRDGYEAVGGGVASVVGVGGGQS